MTPLFRLACTALLIAIGTDAPAQTKKLETEENRFVNIYSRLSSFNQSNYNYDSIDYYSTKLQKEFTRFIKDNPATLSYPFKKLDADYSFDIITSSDGNFRVYSWDSWTGGSMHFYKEIYQWKSNGKVFTDIPVYEETDPGLSYSKIFTVNINKKTYYLAVADGTYSNKDAMQSITAYSIENNKLVSTTPIFKTKTKKLNSIKVFFDFFSVVNRPERPLELITYDEKLQIIYIPVVNEKDQVTKKNILYQLKGNYFEFIGVETGKRQ